MDLWAKVRRSGKDAELMFVRHPEKLGNICIKTNDLIHLLLEEKNRPGLNRKYGSSVRKVMKALPIRLVAFLKKLAKKMAYSYGKYHWTLPGIPDYVVFNKEKKDNYFVEVKAPKARLNNNQKNMIKILMDKGIYVLIAYTDKEKRRIKLEALPHPSIYK